MQDHGRPARQGLSPIFLGQAPSHAESARTLAESARFGTLCTLAVSPAGCPYGSVANYALDEAGQPLLLTSRLAEHTTNFLADPRASLLVAEPTSGDPLAVARVTLLGEVRAVEGDAQAAVRARYLERQPAARYYVNYSDFHFYRLELSAIRYIGGFGRMQWVEPAAYAAAVPDAVWPHRDGIVKHMNDGHGEAMLAMARHYAEVDGREATMVSVDRYGFEMRVVTEAGPRQVRLPFPRIAESAEAVRGCMMAMLGEARGG